MDNPVKRRSRHLLIWCLLIATGIGIWGLVINLYETSEYTILFFGALLLFSLLLLALKKSSG